MLVRAQAGASLVWELAVPRANAWLALVCSAFDVHRGLYFRACDSHLPKYLSATHRRLSRAGTFWIQAWPPSLRGPLRIRTTSNKGGQVCELNVNFITQLDATRLAMARVFSARSFVTRKPW